VIRIVVNPRALNIEDLEPAIRILRGGGVVAYPTETFYGLAADPRSAPAVKRIFSIKRRAADQALPLIAASLSQIADHVGAMTPLARRLAARGWPGPLTLLIPASPLLCGEIHPGTGNVAVRIPGDSVARSLSAAAGHAITSTSANLSGQPPPSTPEEVASTIGDVIDALIDAGRTPGGPPSTIVDAIGEAPVLVRAGAIAWERVLEFLH
jgi:L-threonylcarbamoyladenylate synthase